MPMYSMKCTLCAKVDEVILPVSQMDTPKTCSCCGEPMKRIEFPGCSVYIEQVRELWE
jgi:predicted nucleic acid-binding Zn ribbon protein